MAHKRMFSKDITTSDAFREMPASSQALYFHIGMEADDDGFIDNYKGLMRATNASEDDLRVLLSKRFLILFPSKVVVVKHWLLNNTIRKDRYTETKHLEEKRLLIVKENGAYTDDLDSGNQVATKWQPSIEENRKEELVVAEPPTVDIPIGAEERPTKTSKSKYKHSKEVFSWFPNPQKSWAFNTTELKHAELLFDRGEAEVKKRLRFLKEHEGEDFLPSITKPSDLERKWEDIKAYAKRNR